MGLAVQLVKLPPVVPGSNIRTQAPAPLLHCSSSSLLMPPETAGCGQTAREDSRVWTDSPGGQQGADRSPEGQQGVARQPRWTAGCGQTAWEDSRVRTESPGGQQGVARQLECLLLL